MFAPVTYIVKDVSNEITRHLTETSKESYKAVSGLNENVLNLLIGRGIIASNLVSLLKNLVKRESKSQNKLPKDPTSIRVNDFLTIETIPVTLYDNLLTFQDSNKKFRLKGDFLKKTII